MLEIALGQRSSNSEDPRPILWREKNFNDWLGPCMLSSFQTEENCTCTAQCPGWACPNHSCLERFGLVLLSTQVAHDQIAPAWSDLDLCSPVSRLYLLNLLWSGMNSAGYAAGLHPLVLVWPGQEVATDQGLRIPVLRNRKNTVHFLLLLHL